METWKNVLVRLDFGFSVEGVPGRSTSTSGLRGRPSRRRAGAVGAPVAIRRQLLRRPVDAHLQGSRTGATPGGSGQPDRRHIAEFRARAG